MTPQQLSHLQHAIGADEFGRPRVDRNHFVTDPSCADGAICESLVSLGAMVRGGKSELTGGMMLYRVTDAGRALVTQHSPKPPRVTAAQRRYQDYLRADSGLRFFEWIRSRQRAKNI